MSMFIINILIVFFTSLACIKETENKIYIKSQKKANNETNNVRANYLNVKLKINKIFFGLLLLFKKNNCIRFDRTYLEQFENEPAYIFQYGGNQNNVANQVICPPTDRFCYEIGTGNNLTGNSFDSMYMNKRDKQNRLVCSVAFGGQIGNSIGNSLIFFRKSIWAVGSTEEYGAGLFDILLTRFNRTDCSLRKALTIGGSQNDFGNYISATENENMLITADTESFGNGKTDAFNLRLGRGGAVIWATTFGTGAFERCYKITQTNDTNVLSLCWSSLLGNFDNNIVLTKQFFDGGAIQWQKTYGGPGFEQARGLTELYNGFIGIAGFTRDSFQNGTNILIIVTSEVGTQQFSQSIGGDNVDEATDISSTSDGMIVIGNTYSANPQETFNIFFMKYNLSFAITEFLYFNGTDRDLGTSIIKKDNQSFAFCGRSRSFTTTNEFFQSVYGDLPQNLFSICTFQFNPNVISLRRLLNQTNIMGPKSTRVQLQSIEILNPFWQLINFTDQNICKSGANNIYIFTFLYSIFILLYCF